MVLLLYLFIILYWYIYGRHDYETQKRYIYITSIFILLIMGLRNCAIYDDTLGYVLNFEDLKYDSIAEIIDNNHKDTFFWVFSYYISQISGGNYTIWLCVISAVYIIPVLFLLKYFSPNPMVSWVAFIFNGLLFFSMAGLRQTMAMGLVILAFIALTKRKDMWYFLLIGLAYLFHGTSLISLLIYPIVKFNIKFTKWITFYYLILTIVVIAIGEAFLHPLTTFLGRYDARYGDYVMSEGSTYTYLLIQICLVVPSLYILQSRMKEVWIAWFSNLSMLAIVFVAGSPIISEMFRVSMYFSWAEIILFAIAMNEVYYRNRSIPILFISLITIYLLFISPNLLREYLFFFEDSYNYVSTHYILE